MNCPVCKPAAIAVLHDEDDYDWSKDEVLWNGPILPKSYKPLWSHQEPPEDDCGA